MPPLRLQENQNGKEGRELSDRWDHSKTPSKERPRRLLLTPTVINIANRESRQPFVMESYEQ